MQRRQLDPVVDALDLPDVVDDEAPDPATGGAGVAEDVGEVELALGVVGVQPGRGRRAARRRRTRRRRS